MKSTRDDPLFALEDLDWLSSREAKRWLSETWESPASTGDTQWMKKMRSKIGEVRASLIAYQAELRRLAERKFSDPELWLWTRPLLEQASDEISASLAASYFPQSVEVIDYCCGAGADTLALMRRARDIPGVVGVDLSPAACSLAKQNLELHGVEGEIESLDACLHARQSDAWIHIDPDRRPNGNRTTSLEYSLPSLPFLSELVETAPGGSIKVAPATDLPEEFAGKVGRQWIGVGRSVRQQRFWWGAEEMPSGTTTVSLFQRDGTQGSRSGGSWRHLSFLDSERTDADGTIGSFSDNAAWIGDVDPAVRAASATTWIAAQCQATVVGDEHGYLIADDMQPSWFVDWFQILSVSSIDTKKIRKMLRDRHIGHLEIKKRGIDLDIDRLRRELRLEGEETGTLILLREGNQRLAVLTKRPPS